ncbi:AMP-binding protein [Solihabitans fulvus]|uniref:AMP-binding protein n=1 Tax=Solihabitans fulvus TaxID=1892852 RepID=UPI001661BC93|nr:AMP-binding protein [Solihabitans fulvus]
MEDPKPAKGIHFADQTGRWEYRSYVDVVRDSLRVSALLRELGLPRGGIVSLILAQPRDFVAAFMGTLLAGGTPSPIATPMGLRGGAQFPDHVARVLRAATPAVVLSDAALFEVAQRAAKTTGSDAVIAQLNWDEAPAPDDAAGRPLADLALLQFTSGSSGHPKGVRVSRENLFNNVEAIHRWLDWSASDSFVSWLPLYHDMGLVGAMLSPMMASTELWLMRPEQFLRAPLRWLEVLGRQGVTGTTAPSFGYAYAARRVKPEDLAGMDFSAWRVAILGAERVDPTAAADFAALVEPHGFTNTSFLPAYGLAESTLAVTGIAPATGARIVKLASDSLRDGAPVTVADSGRLGVDRPEGAGWLTSCGRPMHGIGVRIVDEDDAALPEGHLGEIVVEGTSVAQGYRTDEGDTLDFSPAGRPTGDAGFTMDGELFVLGRIGDSMKVRGRAVHAEDLEAELARLPGIDAGRCAGVFGSVNGIDVAAVIVEEKTTDWVDGVVALLRSLTSDSVCVLVFRGQRGSILRTSSGKPRRRVMWRQIADGEFGGELVLATDPGALAGSRVL